MNGDPLTYDANGSLTAYTPATGNNSSFTWDVRNRLAGMTRTGASPLTASFAYDYAGRRRSKTLNGTTTTFEYDGADLVNDSGGGVTVHGPGIDQPLVRGGQFGQYYSQDRLGSVTALTDWTGSVTQQYGYSPFGEASQTTGVANPVQFTGRENDETGLMYYRARYYAPEWGRFISEDPIGFAGGSNQYSYANDNPINSVDPSGLASIDFVTVTASVLVDLEEGIDSVTSNVNAAIRAGNIQWAETFINAALESGKATAARATALYGLIAASPAVQRAIAAATKGLNQTAELGRYPNCYEFRDRAVSALQGLGAEKFEVLEMFNNTGRRFLPLAGGEGIFTGHVLIRYGNMIIDSLTGAAGEPFEVWAQRWLYGGAEFFKSYTLR